MRPIIFCLMIVIGLGCAKTPQKGANNNMVKGAAGSLEGVDMTGTYKLIGAECSNDEGIIATASFTADSSISELSINGNEFTLTHQINAENLDERSMGVACDTVSRGEIIFDESSQVTMTNTSSETSTMTDCTAKMILTNFNGGDITPTQWAITIGSTLRDDNVESYFYNSEEKILGISTNLEIADNERNRVNSVCFLTYIKL